MSLADVIIWLANRGGTGVLTVEQEPITKTITVESGAAVRVSSSSPRELLGQCLVNFGLVTEDQLTRAFQVQKETKVLLGRILVMIGIVREEQIAQTLEYLVRETILDAIRWTSGRFLYEQQEKSEIRPEIEVAVPLLDIHREGARRATLWDQYRRVFRSSSLALLVHDERAPQLPAESFDARILALARLGLNLETIALELHATDFQLYSRLAELHRLGIVEPCEPQPTFRSPAPPTPPPGTATGDLLRRQPHPTPPRRPSELPRTPSSSPPAPQPLALRPTAPPSPAAAAALAAITAPDPTAVPALLRPLEDLLRTTRMDARERYILTRIDGVRSIQSIMQVSPMANREAIEIFQRFAREGLIAIR